jgi:hypothetical protein
LVIVSQRNPMNSGRAILSIAMLAAFADGTKDDN